MGVPKLHRLLVAFARKNPNIGYCQGMNLVAATCLLGLPTEEMSFWQLVAIIEDVLPPDFYATNLSGSFAEQALLKYYLGKVSPSIAHHLHKLGIELETITFGWFLSLFSACFTTEVSIKEL